MTQLLFPAPPLSGLPVRGRSKRISIRRIFCVGRNYEAHAKEMGVAVDREACAFYKEALDAILPPEYSEIVFTGSNNDAPHLKKWHLDGKKEKQIRKNFTKPGEWPKILIVTEKLLTGFDAPILYAMYLDKPMRDHTLLQAIARVNRLYEDESGSRTKEFGFIVDYAGVLGELDHVEGWAEP